MIYTTITHNNRFYVQYSKGTRWNVYKKVSFDTRMDAVTWIVKNKLGGNWVLALRDIINL